MGVPLGFQNFATHFLNEVLFQDVAHINDLPLLGNAQVVLGILSSCVTRQPSYLTRTVSPSSFMFLLASFDTKNMQIYGDIMGPKSWESFHGPLTKHRVRLPISFSDISLFSMENCVPSIFLRS
jgi:hypothetical protein